MKTSKTKFEWKQSTAECVAVVRLRENKEQYFKRVGFEEVKNASGRNRFTMSPAKWINSVDRKLKREAI